MPWDPYGNWVGDVGTYSPALNTASYTATWTWTGTTTGYHAMNVPQAATVYSQPPPVRRELDGDVLTGNGGWANPGRANVDPEAQQKARELLLDHLTPEQQRMYEEYGYFDVPCIPGLKDDDVWRIKGYEGVFLVQLVEEAMTPDADHYLEKWCIHIASGYAEADCQLSQLVLLETDPVRFFEMANRHWQRPRLGPPDPKVAAAMAEIESVEQVVVEELAPVESL